MDAAIAATDLDGWTETNDRFHRELVVLGQTSFVRRWWTADRSLQHLPQTLLYKRC